MKRLYTGYRNKQFLLLETFKDVRIIESPDGEKPVQITDIWSCRHEREKENVISGAGASGGATCRGASVGFIMFPDLSHIVRSGAETAVCVINRSRWQEQFLLLFLTHGTTPDIKILWVKLNVWCSEMHFIIRSLFVMFIRTVKL